MTNSRRIIYEKMNVMWWIFGKINDRNEKELSVLEGFFADAKYKIVVDFIHFSSK